ncbi:hypothetical protein, partial [Bradyrhizobium sp. 160]
MNHGVDTGEAVVSALINWKMTSNLNESPISLTRKYKVPANEPVSPGYQRCGFAFAQVISAYRGLHGYCKIGAKTIPKRPNSAPRVGLPPIFANLFMR